MQSPSFGCAMKSQSAALLRLTGGSVQAGRVRSMSAELVDTRPLVLPVAAIVREAQVDAADFAASVRGIVTTRFFFRLNFTTFLAEIVVSPSSKEVDLTLTLTLIFLFAATRTLTPSPVSADWSALRITTFGRGFLRRSARRLAAFRRFFAAFRRFTARLWAAFLALFFLALFFLAFFEIEIDASPLPAVRSAKAAPTVRVRARARLMIQAVIERDTILLKVSSHGKIQQVWCFSLSQG